MRGFHSPGRWSRVLVTALLALSAPLAAAWSDKPVKVVVPGPAGGIMDVMARILADQLSKDLGTPFVVENKPGAGGAIAMQAMLSRPADGQSIMVTASNVLTEIPHVMKTGFDPIKDVRPIAAVSQVRLLLVSSPSIPAQDFAGLLAYIKANPKSLSFASHSAGTASHYAGMMLNVRAGADMQHVAFAGAPPALNQIMGGQIPLMFDATVTSIPLIAAGKLRAYGIAGSSRHPRLPNVPTFVELGYPELDISNWYGVVVSSKISNELAERMNAAVQKAAAVPRVRDQLIGLGFEPMAAQTSAELAKSVRADFDRNAAIVNKFQINLNQ